MALPSGSRIGSYEVIETLGIGGMGEVYRARDRVLGREVAIKLLAREVADDPERLGRLKREARSLAALNHPHITTVHGFEEQENTSFIVMEVVEGETLAERLEAGSMAVEKALELGIQIARALEAAHERGIVHRDLKPDNVKITPEGDVKVLDFGLAKPLRDEAAHATGVSDSPTATVAPTADGVVMGTPPYMSPEQIRGEEVDRRTDVWAFGCLLYEMLTGRRAFAAETDSDTLAQILEREPDWNALPAATPVAVRRLLRRSLRKDQDRRLQHIGDARLEIEEATGEESPGWAQSREVEEPRRRGISPWAIAALVAVLTVAGVLVTLRSGDREPVETRRLEFEVDAEMLASTGAPALVLSPDGERLVIASRPTSDMSVEPRLHLRALDETDSEPLPGTEGGEKPFFSPDSRWVGFFDERDGQLKKIPVDGSAPLPLSEWEGSARGATWGENGTIVLARNGKYGLLRVAASGGELEAITTPEPGVSHRWPHLLPGSRIVLFTAFAAPGDGRIEALSLESGEIRTIVQDGMFARYVRSGHLLYVREGTLHAAAFDPERAELLGSPRPVLQGIVSDPRRGSAQFSVAGDGTLVYLGEGDRSFRNTVQWASRDGALTALIPERGTYLTPALSPDGSRLAVAVGPHPELGPHPGDDIWIRDIERSTMTRLTFDEAPELYPTWSPDGRWVAYGATRDGTWQVWARRADGTGEARQLTTVGFPADWSGDGRVLATLGIGIAHLPEGTLGETPLEPVEPEPFLDREFNDNHPRFSPDGRWIAYESNESGQFEVYVRPFPDGAGRWQVSTDGGRFATWSHDGRELFYLDENRIVAVPYTVSGGSFSAGPAETIVELPRSPTRSVPRPWDARIDVAPDDRRFVVVQSDEADRLRESVRPMIVFHWLEELRQRVPVSGR